MSVRLLLTDEAWAEIAPILATLKSRAGRPPVLSERLFIEAVLYRARTGLPWRDLPKDVGRWDAVYNRFRRWELRGVWRQLWEHLQTDASPLTRCLSSFDTSCCRVDYHQIIRQHALALCLQSYGFLPKFREEAPVHQFPESRRFSPCAHLTCQGCIGRIKHILSSVSPLG